MDEDLVSIDTRKWSTFSPPKHLIYVIQVKKAGDIRDDCVREKRKENDGEERRKRLVKERQSRYGPVTWQSLWRGMVG